MTGMAHNPINHPLRPIYRGLALLAGVYLVAFGVVGLIVTAGSGCAENGRTRLRLGLACRLLLV